MSQTDDVKAKSITMYSELEGFTTSDSIHDRTVIVYDPLRQVVFEDYISNVTSKSQLNFKYRCVNNFSCRRPECPGSDKRPSESG